MPDLLLGSWDGGSALRFSGSRLVGSISSLIALSMPVLKVVLINII